MHSVVYVNLHCRVASSHLPRQGDNVERDVHFKKELDFLIYMRRLAAGVKPCLYWLRGRSIPKKSVTDGSLKSFSLPSIYSTGGENVSRMTVSCLVLEWISQVGWASDKLSKEMSLSLFLS